MGIISQLQKELEDNHENIESITSTLCNDDQIVNQIKPEIKTDLVQEIRTVITDAEESVQNHEKIENTLETKKWKGEDSD
jgi:hypothetical protein